MNNREIIYKYKNMIKSGYWGIVSRIRDLISDVQEKSSKYLHIGDNLQKKNFIHNNITYVIIYNKNYNDINLYLLTIENSFQFGIILFQKENKDIAIIQDLFAFGGPNVSQIEVMEESILITNLMILICKKMNIKKILVKDNTIYKIYKPNTKEYNKFTSGIDLNMDIYYTLITGKPWYSQFGFINCNKRERKYIEDNYKKLKDKKVKDYNKDIFIDIQFIDMYEKYKETDIKEFIHILKINNIEKFLQVYDILYQKLGLNYIMYKKYYLEL